MKKFYWILIVIILLANFGLFAYGKLQESNWNDLCQHILAADTIITIIGVIFNFILTIKDKNTNEL